MVNRFESKLTELIDGLQNSDQTKTRLDLNKFYQERIETIRTRLWNSLTWIAAAQGAALVLILEQGKLRTDPGPVLTVGQPALVLALAGLGILLSRYMKLMVEDGEKHILSNQRNSNLVLGLNSPESPVNRTAFNVMTTLAKIALWTHCVLAAVGFICIVVWLFGLDLTFARLAAPSQPVCGSCPPNG